VKSIVPNRSSQSGRAGPGSSDWASAASRFGRRFAKTLEELLHGGDRIAAEASLPLIVLGSREERRVRARAMLLRTTEARAEEVEGFLNQRTLDDWTGSGRASRCTRTPCVVQESEDEVLGVLVLMPILEGENLEHRIG
jgi:hypothetical protein